MRLDVGDVALLILDFGLQLPDGGTARRPRQVLPRPVDVLLRSTLNGITGCLRCR